MTDCPQPRPSAPYFPPCLLPSFPTSPDFIRTLGPRIGSDRNPACVLEAGGLAPDQPTLGRTRMQSSCLGPLVKCGFLGLLWDLSLLDSGGGITFHKA